MRWHHPMFFHVCELLHLELVLEEGDLVGFLLGEDSTFLKLDCVEGTFDRNIAYGFLFFWLEGSRLDYRACNFSGLGGSPGSFFTLGFG